MTKRRGWGVAAAVACCLVAGCTPDPVPVPEGTSTSAVTSGTTVGPSARPTVIAPTITTPSDPVPVVQTGVLTGPGVTDIDITLGVLVDRSVDRGFAQGLALWQQTVNAAGGICQRLVQFAGAGSAGVPSSLQLAYSELGPRVLGFATLSTRAHAPELAAALSADQIPAVTPSGISGDLQYRSPLVVGPTDDLLAINALSNLIRTAGLEPGATVGVLADNTAEAQDALLGVTWEAARRGVVIELADASAGVPADWSGLPAVLMLSTPQLTTEAARELPAGIPIMTVTSGYDPAVTTPAEAARIQVTTATPAFTSDHPGAVAVAAAFAEANLADPGPLTFEGYATGAAWQRILNTACSAGSLTRAGIDAAVASVGPAPIDSLFGASDPGAALRHLPASRSAALSQADPSAPGGLTPVTGLESADGIADYSPAN